MAHFADLTAAVGVEELQARHGDGISRPVPGEATTAYRLSVVQPGVCPMTVWLHAESAAKAVEYGKARWPNAVVRNADK
jgi:hypothetical protein